VPSSQSLRCRDLTLALDGPPRLMGILNVTDDSFFDGGRHFALDAALARARQLVAEGADLLDVGGQSTRPGYKEITAAEEIARTVPVIRALVAEFPDLPLSIDTYKPAVAAAALDAGAHVLNDIHGLQGPGGPALARLALESGAAVVLMHNDPALRDLPPDVDPIPGVLAWLRRSLDLAAVAGLSAERIVLDPGIGFGKTQAQNLTLLARLDALHALGQPILLGVSRKSVIAHACPGLAPEDRLEGTLALTALAVRQGVQLHRVHDVQANRRAARVAFAYQEAAECAAPTL
jgi:dihydropteroate synthase